MSSFVTTFRSPATSQTLQAFNYSALTPNTFDGKFQRCDLCRGIGHSRTVHPTCIASSELTPVIAIKLGITEVASFSFVEPGYLFLSGLGGEIDWGIYHDSRLKFRIDFAPFTMITEDERVRIDNWERVFIASNKNIPNPATGKIGGDPDWINGDLRPIATLASRSFEKDRLVMDALRDCGVKPEMLSHDAPGRLESAKSLDKAEFQGDLFHRAVSKWRLLFQVDSVPSIGMEFGDAGRLHVLIDGDRPLMRGTELDNCWCCVSSH